MCACVRACERACVRVCVCKLERPLYLCFVAVAMWVKVLCPPHCHAGGQGMTFDPVGNRERALVLRGAGDFTPCPLLTCPAHMHRCTVTALQSHFYFLVHLISFLCTLEFTVCLTPRSRVMLVLYVTFFSFSTSLGATLGCILEPPTAGKRSVATRVTFVPRRS